MKLKNYQIHECAGILSEIRINRLTDKDVKLKLVKNYLELRKASNTLVEQTNEIVKKFQEDWKDAVIEVRAIRKEGRILDDPKFADFLIAESDANAAIMQMNVGETELNLECIDYGVFVNAVGDEEIPLASIGILHDAGIIQ